MKFLPLILLPLILISPFSMAHHTPVKDLKCQDFLQVDDDLVPVVVGYIVGVNDAGNVNIVEVDELDNVEVDDVVDFCKQNPKAKVSDAVKASTKTGLPPKKPNDKH
ncbi:HdeA/HdeB family chaperone [Shewanella surugensis]|uniref:HdeA/HdeB family chaperone n=1 Tax=Shewanella surugensis TaxID=212020 RepID=A0ABT0LA56_9GAMM|nr:HdeA/HdeB family chaperone [Shewanella surugensis]MCL1124543.1 HdeA/HdeB family chaperone [Shewanella surugensis]